MFFQVRPQCYRAQTVTGLLCTARSCPGPACLPRGRAWCSACWKRSLVSSQRTTRWGPTLRRTMKAAGVRRCDSSGANCPMRLTTQTRSTTQSGRTPSTFPLPHRPLASTPTQRLSTQTQRLHRCCPRVLANRRTTC